MDIQQARTFLAIVNTGSFQLAAQQLFVTQSAVSLRVKRMEEELGQTLFTRSKAGAVMTPAGEQFARFARSMIRVWEEAQHQVAVPEGYDNTLIVGAHHTLWPGLGLRWLRLLERQLPQTAFRCEVGRSDTLVRMMGEGTCDVAVLYTPQVRPGMTVEQLVDDQLVLVSAADDFEGIDDPRYLFVDWSSEFLSAHKTRFPELRSPRVTMSLGSTGLDYVISNGRAGYFPARVVEDAVAGGALRIVEDAPAFPFPTYVMWQAGLDNEAEVREAVRLLKRVADKVEEEQTEALEEAGVAIVDEGLSDTLTTQLVGDGAAEAAP